MVTENQLNYYRIAEAIEYIKRNFRTQPTLDELAEKLNLSPFHFQRLFSDWAGTTPKKFLQYISVEHAKKLLSEKQTTLFDAAIETGLSSTSRLHDLFVKIESMTPGEYKNGGKSLSINFSFSESLFGNIIVGSTTKGVCYMAFYEKENEAMEALKSKFPNAGFFHKLDLVQEQALFIFKKDWNRMKEIKLHLKGSAFQLKVWEALLKIPMGKLATYGNIAKAIGNPNASRAVGTAIGNNPVAYLIPCHRVIQSSGTVGGYMWGSARKAAIIGWESARTSWGF